MANYYKPEPEPEETPQERWERFKRQNQQLKEHFPKIKHIFEEGYKTKLN